jgi:hypothetical protein
VRTAVVYESMFGNTKAIAEAVAYGLAQSGPRPDVVVVPVADAGDRDLAGLELLVVGGPTHLRRMTSRRTRELRAGPLPGQASGGGGDPGEWARSTITGVREWLAALADSAPGRHAAAFDTRLRYFPADGAAPLIARRLRSRGYRVEAVPRGFLVESAQGPIVDGEAERAQAWGTALGNSHGAS